MKRRLFVILAIFALAISPLAQTKEIAATFRQLKHKAHSYPGHTFTKKFRGSKVEFTYEPAMKPTVSFILEDDVYLIKSNRRVAYINVFFTVDKNQVTRSLIVPYDKQWLPSDLGTPIAKDVVYYNGEVEGSALTTYEMQAELWGLWLYNQYKTESFPISRESTHKATNMLDFPNQVSVIKDNLFNHKGDAKGKEKGHASLGELTWRKIYDSYMNEARAAAEDAAADLSSLKKWQPDERIRLPGPEGTYFFPSPPFGEMEISSESGEKIVVDALTVNHKPETNRTCEGPCFGGWGGDRSMAPPSSIQNKRFEAPLHATIIGMLIQHHGYYTNKQRDAIKYISYGIPWHFWRNTVNRAWSPPYAEQAQNTNYRPKVSEPQYYELPFGGTELFCQYRTYTVRKPLQSNYDVTYRGYWVPQVIRKVENCQQ